MNKKSKREALEQLRARKEGRALTSRTDEFEVKEDDVYYQLEEDEYQKLVEARREREDFVVDDGKFEHTYNNERFQGLNLKLHLSFN